jgi:hypothetical protein
MNDIDILMGTSKNVIPVKAGVHKLLTLLDSRLRGSDKLGIVRGSLMIYFIASGKRLKSCLNGY